MLFKIKRRRNVVILFLVVSFLPYIFHAQSYFQSACRFYQSKQYDSAWVQFNLQLKHNPSAETHYNAGNAAYKLKKTGWAIWHYKSALKIKPGFHNAYDNLQLAYEKRLEPISPSVLSYFKKYLQLNVSSDSWFILSAVCLLLLCLVLIFKIFKVFKFKFLYLSGITLFLFFVFFCFGFFQYRYQTQITNGIIVNPQTKFFQEPNSASESFTVLNEGSEFKPLQISDQWLLILTEDNQEGWIIRRFAGLY